MAVFLVGEVICPVTSFHDRDLSLLNHVKYDSYLILFSSGLVELDYHYSYRFYSPGIRIHDVAPRMV